jgi:hypothetical protein
MSASDDADEVTQRRMVLAKKYDGDMLEPEMFQRAHGKLYLVSPEFVAQMDSVWKDRWLMSQQLVVLKEMKSPSTPKPLTRSERRLTDVLTVPRGTL